MRQVRVYTASKLDHAELWKHIRVRFPQIYFTARWPFFVGYIEEGPECAEHFWQDDEEDVRRSDVVLVYAANSEEKLRGALVEAGMGIAMGKLVIVVGKHPDYSTWQFHPQVEHADSIETALAYALTLDWT